MVAPFTITATEMRRINQSAILEIIRRTSPLSRTQIAKMLHISLPTVMRIVDELMKDGLVLAQAETMASGGRPRELLEFNAQGQVVIGIDLGGTKMYGAVTNLGGEIQHEVNLAYHGTSGEASYVCLTELIQELIDKAQIDGRKIRGIGVGAPGITLFPQGIVTWAPSLNWRDFPLKARLSEQFGLAVTVENDVNLAALGEAWFGAAQHTQNMALIAIGTGIGAGLIIDGALYRGAHQSSGEVGYFLPGRQFLGKVYDGFGALEGLASGTGIAERACEVLSEQMTPEDLVKISAEDVFAALRRGEAWTETIIAETVDYLAMGIAGVSALLDPEVIVIGGGVAGSADVLVERIQARLKGTLPVAPHLVVSTLGQRAAVLGAITQVLQYTSNHYVVRKLT